MIKNKSVKTLRVMLVSDSDARFTQYYAMAAHAGRTDRTGAKVHMTSIMVWKESGNVTVGSVNCSNNGNLRGSLITEPGYGFEHVSCKKCNASPEAAAFRNAKAIDVEFNF